MTSILNLSTASRRVFTSLHGFTLVEMMVVVAIVGILASIAIPSLSRYLAKARSSEAPLKLKEIYSAVATYYAQDHISAGGALAGPGSLSTTRCIVLPTGYLHGGPYPHTTAGNTRIRLNWYAAAQTLGIDDASPHVFSYANEYSTVEAGECGANPTTGGALYLLRAVGNVDGDSNGGWGEKERHRLYIGVDDDGNLFHGGGVKTYRPGQW